VLESADGRHTVIKVLKAKVERLKADTGATSFQQIILCERCGFLLAILETTEVNAIEGRGLDTGSYVQAINALSGLLSKLGLRKATKRADLATYLESKEAGG